MPKLSDLYSKKAITITINGLDITMHIRMDAIPWDFIARHETLAKEGDADALMHYTSQGLCEIIESWDIMEDDEVTPIPITPETFTRTLGLSVTMELLNQMMGAVMMGNPTLPTSEDGS